MLGMGSRDHPLREDGSMTAGHRDSARMSATDGATRQERLASLADAAIRDFGTLQSERNQRIFLAGLWAGFGLCAAGTILFAAQLCLPMVWGPL